MCFEIAEFVPPRRPASIKADTLLIPAKIVGLSRSPVSKCQRPIVGPFEYPFCSTIVSADPSVFNHHLALQPIILLHRQNSDQMDIRPQWLTVTIRINPILLFVKITNPCSVWTEFPCWRSEVSICSLTELLLSFITTTVLLIPTNSLWIASVDYSKSFQWNLFYDFQFKRTNTFEMFRQVSRLHIWMLNYTVKVRCFSKSH